MGRLLLSLLPLALASTPQFPNLIVPEVSHTFYGYPDNDPPGPAISYDCGRGLTAAGTGTYADPLTFASAPDEFDYCEIIYDPYLRKYLRHEDYCVQCVTDWGNKSYHIDVWTGSNWLSGDDDQIACEKSLTPQAQSQSVMRYPSSNLTVDVTPLYTVSVDESCEVIALCNVDHVYPDYNLDN
ncbi:uncharacterized protein BO80DRAFT_441874 [Aspergillus ibericus CBS 121593]|uniref:Uncharacterized protein n=1 Tax=Aspergillus ibericus CBS 121593 TaxID=1448316 RepID=A0A395HA10_9EURO|nr:hypothetical protein BO80DRAFT_441874 [Aspergillus ibericus CBS 121593]RAL04409.1 hypothetical protein BO80DRAFT_441874 [Aspergillus ibericus CBS 121593]